MTAKPFTAEISMFPAPASLGRNRNRTTARSQRDRVVLWVVQIDGEGRALLLLLELLRRLRHGVRPGGEQDAGVCDDARLIMQYRYGCTSLFAVVYVVLCIILKDLGKLTLKDKYSDGTR